jgi:hypothetical protein
LEQQNGGKEVVTSTRLDMCQEECVPVLIPNKLGNSLTCVKNLVNGEEGRMAASDEKHKCEVVGSAVPDVGCEDKTNGVQTKGTAIACTSNTFPLMVPGVNLPVGEEEMGGSGECNGSKEDWASHLGPQLEGGVGSNGPSILRTRKGDL